MMMYGKDIYFITCILLLIVLPVEDTSETDVKFKITYKHKCLVSDFVLTYFVDIPLRQCAKECAMRSQCRSVNYKRKLSLCELFSTKGDTFIDNTSKTGPCVFVRKTEFDPEMLPLENCSEETCPREAGCPRFTLTNGKVFGNLQSAGSKLKFECNDGYLEAEDEKYTTCNSTGVWSYMPHCILGVCSTTTPAEQSNIPPEYTNVAIHKQVNMSSQFSIRGGHLMVDGNRNQGDVFCSHTKNGTESGNYALVDLGQNYTIYAIHVVNRKDCCTDRLGKVTITIGDQLDNMKRYVYHEQSIGLLCTFILTQPCFGQYLKIKNASGKALNICELEVYGINNNA